MQLEYVYGYAGVDNTANNLFYNMDHKLVYYTAAVAIIYDPTTHTQAFFQVGMWPKAGTLYAS